MACVYVYIYISASQATSSSVGGPKHSEYADYPKIVVPRAFEAAQHYITAIGENPQGSGGLASNRGPAFKPLGNPIYIKSIHPQKQVLSTCKTLR